MTMFQIDMARSTKGRVIDGLRKQFRGVWRYEWPCYWHNSEGWTVTAYSRISIDVAGGESYSTEYRRDDTGEVVFP